MDHMTFQPPHIWGQGILPMDYPHPPFTSPPATPMTPMTPMTPVALNHHPAFPVQYDVPPPHLFPSAPPPPPPPFPSPPDYRLFALCQHLKTYSKVTDSDAKRWWEDFMTEFFHDNSTLVIETDLGEGTRKYHLSRQWIPLYFQSLVENGVTSVHLDLGQCISTYHQSLQELECRNATMETSHTSPHPTKVCINGALVVDFSLEDKPRILSWYFNINDHIEFVPRGNSTSVQSPGIKIESGVQENITNKGILPSTQKLLLEAGRLESTNYHHDVPMGNITCTSSELHRHWQDMSTMISVQSGLDVMHSVPMQPEALPTAGMLQSMSPGGGIPHSMALIPSSPCLPPSSSSSSSSSTGGGGTKTKASRSASNGGSRKRHSPTPATGSGGSSAKKTHQCMLVAAEAVALKDADDLPFGVEERRITRVDNHRRSRHNTNSPRTAGSTSKTSPTTSNSDSVKKSVNGSVNGSINGLTSKLCHLNSKQTSTVGGGGALSHSATVDSSAQGMEIGQGPSELFNSPLQPWTSEAGIPVLNANCATLTTTR